MSQAPACMQCYRPVNQQALSPIRSPAPQRPAETARSRKKPKKSRGWRKFVIFSRTRFQLYRLGYGCQRRVAREDREFSPTRTISESVADRQRGEGLRHPSRQRIRGRAGGEAGSQSYPRGAGCQERKAGMPSPLRRRGRLGSETPSHSKGCVVEKLQAGDLNAF